MANSVAVECIAKFNNYPIITIVENKRTYHIDTQLIKPNNVLGPLEDILLYAIKGGKEKNVRWRDSICQNMGIAVVYLVDSDKASNRPSLYLTTKLDHSETTYVDDLDEIATSTIAINYTDAVLNVEVNIRTKKVSYIVNASTERHVFSSIDDALVLWNKINCN